MNNTAIINNDNLTTSATIKNAIKSEKQSTTRILTFDFARGLAILLMIVIHVLTFYASPEVQQGVFYRTVFFLLSWPSATLFVFLMGILVAYSNSQNVALGLKRSAMLFVLGYVLNLLRETLPTWLSLEFGLVTYEQLGKYTPINGLLVTDILQFAGLAFAVCILLKHFIHSPIIWLAIAVAIIFGSPYVWDIQTGITAVDQGLKLFWGNKDQGAIFPLFPWLAYPIVGMAFGYWFKQSTNINRSFLHSLFYGVVIIGLGSVLSLSNIEYHAADHLRPGPGIVVALTGGVFVWLYMCHLLVIAVNTDNRFFKLLFFWSKHVTTMYFIHWLFVGWGLMIFGSEQLNLQSVLLWLIAVALLSHFSLKAWLKFTKK